MGSLNSGHLHHTKLHDRFYSDFTHTQRDRNNMEAHPYPQYQYTMAHQGEVSPYSVSYELYKHVLPQYFQLGRPTSRGSVLV